MLKFKVTGLRELGEALRQYGPNLARRALPRATYEAAQVFREEAFRLAPVSALDKPHMRNALSTFKGRGTGPFQAAYGVGIRGRKLSKGEKKALRFLRSKTDKPVNLKGDPYYWRFLEFGTSKMVPRPFMRPAFESKVSEALERFRVVLGEQVERVAMVSRIANRK